MTHCFQCGQSIPTEAETWPGESGGNLCQCCWEAECSRSWWQMVDQINAAIIKAKP